MNWHVGLSVGSSACPALVVWVRVPTIRFVIVTVLPQPYWLATLDRESIQ